MANDMGRGSRPAAHGLPMDGSTGRTRRAQGWQASFDESNPGLPSEGGTTSPAATRARLELHAHDFLIRADHLVARLQEQIEGHLSPGGSQYGAVQIFAFAGEEALDR